jgi:Protein of unknown function (DUF2783)
MSRLRTEPALGNPDDLYEALIEARRDLDDAQSAALDAKLVLLLANHIGDLDVIREAIEAARKR